MTWLLCPASEGLTKATPGPAHTARARAGSGETGRKKKYGGKTVLGLCGKSERAQSTASTSRCSWYDTEPPPHAVLLSAAGPHGSHLLVPAMPGGRSRVTGPGRQGHQTTTPVRAAPSELRAQTCHLPRRGTAAQARKQPVQAPCHPPRKQTSRQEEPPSATIRTLHSRQLELDTSLLHGRCPRPLEVPAPRRSGPSCRPCLHQAHLTLSHRLSQSCVPEVDSRENRP